MYQEIIEEVSKYIMLKKISWKSNDFRYIYDGIVYAVFVSLGFATIENIIYARSWCALILFFWNIYICSKIIL